MGVQQFKTTWADRISKAVHGGRSVTHEPRHDDVNAVAAGGLVAAYGDAVG